MNSNAQERQAKKDTKIKGNDVYLKCHSKHCFDTQCSTCLITRQNTHTKKWHCLENCTNLFATLHPSQLRDLVD